MGVVAAVSSGAVARAPVRREVARGTGGAAMAAAPATGRWADLDLSWQSSSRDPLALRRMTWPIG